MHALHWLTIGLLGVGGSSIGVYFLMPWLQESLRQIVAWVGAGGIIGGLALMLNIFKHLNQIEKERKSDLRKHTKILNDEVYKKLLHIFIEPSGRFCRKRERMIPVSEEEYRRYEIELMLNLLRPETVRRPTLLPLSSIRMLKWGISHLEHSSYQNIYCSWAKLDSLIKEYNGLIEPLDEELTQTIRKKMHEVLPTFTEWNRDTISVLGNVYYSDIINRFIIEYALSFLATGDQPTFDNSLEKRKRKQHPTQLERFYPWFISPRGWPNTPLVESITEIELKRIESILRAIISEGEIMKKIQRMFEIDHIEIRQSTEAFEKGIQVLAKKIDDPHDDYLVEGKCEKCKEWNR